MNIYYQLLEIIQNAVFGSAELTTSQTFILEQLCTWMSVAVVIAPVIAMVALTVKLLKW